MRLLRNYWSVAISPPWSDSPVPGCSWTEFTVGPATVAWDVDEAAGLLADVVLGRR